MGALDDQLRAGRKKSGGRGREAFKQATYESQADFAEALRDRAFTRRGGSASQRDQARARAKDEERRIIGEQRSLERDFAALQDQRPEDVRNWQQIAQTTIRLGQADDDEAKELSQSLLWAYGDQLKTHIDAEDDEWWEANYTEPPDPNEGQPLWKRALGGAAPVFEYLDQWGQSSLSALAGIEAAIDTSDEVSAGDALAHAIRQGASAVDITRAVPGWGGLSSYLEKDDRAHVIRTSDGRNLSFDRDGDGVINLREALGKDPEAGGRALGAIDLLGTIALDPTTYVTLGTAPLAKGGMRAVEEVAERLAREGVEGVSRAGVREINQQIARAGWKSLDDQQQRLYEGLVRTAVEESVEAGGRSTTRLGRDLVEEQLGSIWRGGQSGVRFGGTTFLPTGRAGCGRRGSPSALPQHHVRLGPPAPGHRRPEASCSDRCPVRQPGGRRHRTPALDHPGPRAGGRADDPHGHRPAPQRQPPALAR